MGENLSPGTVIRHYELIRELGRGGMGVVYLARDTRLGRRVAIKFLATRFGKTERALAEARATAQCNHENIVVIHEVSVYGDMPYMVLEYLDGAPLSEHIRGRALPVGRALELAVPVARALAHAHSFGIVHRDLKPDNVFVTSSGTVKVLDFGIAKALDRSLEDGLGSPANPEVPMGTAAYMAPEQWTPEGADPRADLWAFGLILFQMLTGKHPYVAEDRQAYRLWSNDTNAPVPSILETLPTLPDELASVIDGCLRKQRDRRCQSAELLLEQLEPLLPARLGRTLTSDECPYPGLAPFQQADADRYFGRTNEIRRALSWLSDRPMLAIVGPSGLGKSSFVRAGLMPALRASGESWQVLSLRPGRQGLKNLASLVNRLDETANTTAELEIEQQEVLVSRMRSQPGLAGAILRERARRKQTRILVFVDQFEELFTLVPDAQERVDFLNCLLGIADDAASPLRLVLSMRSDFLDRVAETPAFSEAMTAGLMLLPPLSASALREAITQPAEQVGFHFETPKMVDAMLEELSATRGALSLLQFTASQLWEKRDRKQKQLTQESYDAMGGVGGALAAHADATLSGMTSRAQALTRTLFQRLITPDRTRAIVELGELEELGQSEEITRLVHQLVQSRLLITDKRGDDSSSTVELVHESLINSWPTLARWLDEGQEDAALIAELREVARQWSKKGRPAGLLWRGDALDEARRFSTRFRGKLAAREKQYLDAAFALANRAARIRRALVIAAFTVLTCMVVGASIAFLTIRQAEHASRGAERTAREAEKVANRQAAVAKQEAERAQTAERRVKEQLELISAKEQAQRAAEQRATEAAVNLRISNQQLQLLLEKERERVKDLEQQRRKIIDDLR